MSSSSPTDTAAPYVVDDFGSALQVLSDGTVVRSPPPPLQPPDVNDGRVQWKDAVYDAGRGLGLRMYRPHRRDVADDGEDGKHPVLVYFHGGGFCVGSYSLPKDYAVCLRLAAELPAVVLSFDYRLAPEHRLPAAHEDAAAALLWLRDQLTSGSDDSWLAGSADSRRVFVSGVSAGGSLAHHMAVRFGTSGLEPAASIAGYILLMPGLFSAEPTQSELDTPDTAWLTREMFDRFFRLGMPAGASRDNPLVNPFGPGSPSLEPTCVGRMLVVAAERDLFRDRNVEYAERMKAMGKDVELVVFAGQEHGFFGADPASGADGELVRVISRFVERDGDGPA
ncbi:hypothetical protein CFC21_062838 [Triticum aestivum]|uniref:Alpha/beta hydrolase fold-3 domain-containing protein n=4 Tax=Triticinae TaxID=1648030 RepID=A0A453IUM6_AEGTS|nr:probable carboxylesterase 15 [Aegilops tauschii subsp. strangulata]XP_044378155.1 probable carboxylesterase 15 [Triticum aestivum]KAF7055288.1 hypothetical protein CFC21_062838 [Triticum aestivum]